jgi:hypothetical protein
MERGPDRAECLVQGPFLFAEPGTRRRRACGGGHLWAAPEDGMHAVRRYASLVVHRAHQRPRTRPV